MRVRFIRTLLFALFVLSMSAASAHAGVGIFVNIAPPPIPVYEQPICPGDGYLWTPGYWAWDDDIGDYYWVPGTWVLAPEVGFLWTPGYWGWEGGRYRWWDGYWGPHVGFYGGINYGFGYFGLGFEGGRWDGGHFFYNRAVLNVNVEVIHNVYNTTVVHETVNRVSYNGGNGGINVRPRPEEEAAARDRHVGPIAAQTQHIQAARGNPQMRASVNMGRPAIAATARPGELSGRGVVPAREAGGSYTPVNRGGNQAHPENRTENSVPRPPVHPRDLPAMERPAAPNTGNPKLDRKYQQQQEQMIAKQNQERDKLQQKQEQEHQRLAQQNANEARKQQVEQRHQQQTQQLQQRHEQQRQQMQQKVQKSSPAASKPRK
jgi:hypothetical protein